MLLPEHGGNSGFGAVIDPFDASPEVRLHSSLLFLLDAIGLSRLLPPGRPGELRPEPPTDPDLTLSSHPARATHRKPAGFRQDKEFLRLPVDSILTRVTCLLRSTDITPLPRYY
jgi:hypothetical protein